MLEKALNTAFYDMNWTQIFEYFAFIVQALVLPVGLTTCLVSLYAIVKAILRSRRKRRNEKLNREEIFSEKELGEEQESSIDDEKRSTVTRLISKQNRQIRLYSSLKCRRNY